MTRVARLIAQAERVLEMDRAVMRGFGEDPAAPADPAERLRLREQARIRFEEDLAEAEREVARDPSQFMSATAKLRAWAASRAAARVQSPDAEDVMTSDEITRWRDLWKRYESLLRLGAETKPLSR
jgi:hypothetical protein